MGFTSVIDQISISMWVLDQWTWMDDGLHFSCCICYCRNFSIRTWWNICHNFCAFTPWSYIWIQFLGTIFYSIVCDDLIILINLLDAETASGIQYYLEESDLGELLVVIPSDYMFVIPVNSWFILKFLCNKII